MEKLLEWGTQIATVSFETVTGIIQYLPQILGVVMLLLAGWIVASIGRALVVRLIKGLNRIRSRFKIAGTDALPDIAQPLAVVISKVVFWVIILIFLALSLDVLGLSMFAGWLSRLVNHLPNILSGALIIWAGIVFSGLVGQAVSTAAVNFSDAQRSALARIAQLFTLTLLILMGVDQIGVDITIVVTILSVAIGAALGGLAIAFSLGARDLVSNLIGARYLNADYRIGERIRIGEHEGTVLEISSVSVILETEEGRVMVPARQFSERASVLITREKEDV